MKKKLCVLGALFSLLIVFSVSVCASEAIRLIDSDELFDDEQYFGLIDTLDGLSETYKMDVALVVTDLIYGEDAEDAAVGMYKSLELSEDGMILYIATQDRECYLEPFGKANDAITVSGRDYLLDNITPYLSDNDWYGASVRYTQTAQELLELYAAGTPYDVKPSKNIALPIIIAVAVSIIVAFVSTKNKLAQMKTARDQKKADNYMKPGSMNITFSRDIFLYSRVDRREKPKSNSSSSSSGSNGGGRKF